MNNIYKNDSLDGPQTEYYPNGTLHRISNWKNGKEEGPLAVYFSNGQIGVKATIRNGDKHSIWQFRDSTGTIIDGLPKELK